MSLEDALVIKAINEIASTHNGKIFFRWLARRCFHTRCTIVGNAQTYEVNTVGSVAQAFLQDLYQEIWRNIRPEIRINIDYPKQNDE